MKRVREIEALLKEHSPEVDYNVEAGLERLRAGGVVPAWAAQVPRPRRVWWPWVVGVMLVIGAWVMRPAGERERVLVAPVVREPVVTALPRPTVEALPLREEAPSIEVPTVEPTRVVRKGRRRAQVEVTRQEGVAPPIMEPTLVEEEPPAPSVAPVAQDPQDLVEMRQVAQAERVLARDPGRALALVRAGEQEYPRGYFHEERRYLEVIALVRLGRRDQARVAAYAFFQDFPGSAYRRRIEDSL